MKIRATRKPGGFAVWRGLFAAGMAVGALSAAASSESQEMTGSDLVPAATVVAAQGEVHAANAGEARRKLGRKSRVHVSESLVTGPKSFALAVFTDQTVVKVGSDTELEIFGTGPMELGVTRGVFRVMSAAPAGTRTVCFRMPAPLGRVTIRGTGYAGELRAGRLEIVSLFGRAVEVSNALGSVVITRSKPRTEVIASGLAPAAPAALAREQLEALLTRIAYVNGGAAGARASPVGWGNWNVAGAAGRRGDVTLERPGSPSRIANLRNLVKAAGIGRPTRSRPVHKSGPC